MLDWRILQGWMDGIVDDQFAEPVHLIPWGGGQRVSDEGTQDPARSVIITIGVYRTSGSATGDVMAPGVTVQTQVAQEWIEITEQNMGDPANWHAYDRVFLPDQLPNQQWHTILKVNPSATKRYQVMLARLQQGPGWVAPQETWTRPP
jgi:hypothetical protein